MLSHPAVSEAVCFAVPDEMYGQEIHAAVVIKQGQKATEKELQDYVAKKAAKFKVPKKVLLVFIDMELTRFILRRRSRRPQPERCKEQRFQRLFSNQRQSYKYPFRSNYAMVELAL